MSDPLPAFQTLTILRGHLESAGLSPRKLYGQHFLIDGNLMKMLVAAAELKRTDTVLEVGTGTGSLTSLLAQQAGFVVTVEIDRKIASIAEEVLEPHANVRQIVGDAMKTKSEISPEVIASVESAQASLGGDLKLVANLPYDVATSLVIDLLLSNLPLNRLCFTVQAEVGDRFAAECGLSDYGSVGIIAQSLAVVSRVCKVPPQAFWPRPKVDSAMLCLVPINDRSLLDRVGFARFVRSFFLHRRKTMSHLARREPNADRLLEMLADLGIDPKTRPEQVTIPQWQALFLGTR